MSFSPSNPEPVLFVLLEVSYQQHFFSLVRFESRLLREFQVLLHKQQFISFIRHSYPNPLQIISIIEINESKVCPINFNYIAFHIMF